jgi:hypothetical protein
LRAIKQNLFYLPKILTLTGLAKVSRTTRYYFSLSILAFFFLFLMPPIMLLARIKGDREYAYPWAAWGARRLAALVGNENRRCAGRKT